MRFDIKRTAGLACCSPPLANSLYVGSMGRKYAARSVRNPRGREVAAHGMLAVEHGAGTVELVARVGNGGETPSQSPSHSPHVIARSLESCRWSMKSLSRLFVCSHVAEFKTQFVRRCASKMLVSNDATSARC
jgi:hypothetical protein